MRIQPIILTHPEHVGIFQVSLGISLLGVDKVGELGGISDEEDRRIVEDPIPVTLIGSQLDRETTGVAGSISGSRLSTDGGESDGCANLFAN